MESSWLIQESTDLKPDYFGDVKSFSENNKASYYKVILQMFYHKSIKVNQAGSF